MTRVCSVCSIDKPLDDFEKRKNGSHGRSWRCKTCSSRKSAIYYRANLETRRNAKRKASMNREPGFYSRYQRLSWDEECERYGHDRRTAKTKVRLAVAKGILVKPTVCEECEKDTPSRHLHGHHDDYSKPLEVRWLCKACHARHHRRIESGSRVIPAHDERKTA
jgi:hypothetical protein